MASSEHVGLTIQKPKPMGDETVNLDALQTPCEGPWPDEATPRTLK